MKRIYKYFAVALAVTTLASCDDFLEDNRYPLDEQSNTSAYWNNATNVTNQCNTFYNNYYGYGRGDSGGLFYYKSLSDDQVGRSFDNWAYVNAMASSTDWSSPFVEIRRANYIIENVRQSTLSDIEKRNYEGIARLNRAWQYFDLVRKFGDVQWIGGVVNHTDTCVVYASRDDRDVVMDSVLADLNYACANIEVQSGKTAWSKDMANAMKADITLWEGTFCKYRTLADNGKAADQARATKFLNECVTACENVMASGYEVGGTIDDYQATYNSVSLSGKSNIIFFKEYQNNLMYHSLIAYTCSSTQINGMSKDAFDSYLFKDGKPLALTTCDINDVAIIEYPGVDSDGKPKKADKYSIEHMLSVRDARLAKTIDPVIYFPGCTWARSDAMEMTSSTGYGVSKYDNVSLPLDNRTQTVKNYTCAPIYWIEVVYCNYAEAKAELGTITDTDLDKTINKLYARAGLPALKAKVGFSDPANTWGVSDIIWEVRRCRRNELMFDNWFRYWDLVRWHKLDKLDTPSNPNILLGANISQYFDYVDKYNADVEAYNNTVEEAKRIQKIEIPANNGAYLDGSKGKVRTYNSKYYLYPIPTNQITLNDKLTQNPGWE